MERPCCFSIRNILYNIIFISLITRILGRISSITVKEEREEGKEGRKEGKGRKGGIQN